MSFIATVAVGEPGSDPGQAAANPFGGGAFDAASLVCGTLLVFLLVWTSSGRRKR